ncbi:unnamed protein product [Schistosoma turkestanicum]|nr:unnamed protein product [Schistosoma turkestanicum]
MSPTGLFGYPTIGYGNAQTIIQHGHLPITRGGSVAGVGPGGGIQPSLLTETNSSSMCNHHLSNLPSGLFTSPTGLSANMNALVALSVAANAAAVVSASSSSSSTTPPGLTTTITTTNMTTMNCTNKSLSILSNPNSIGSNSSGPFGTLFSLLPYTSHQLIASSSSEPSTPSSSSSSVSSSSLLFNIAPHVVVSNDSTLTMSIPSNLTSNTFLLSMTEGDLNPHGIQQPQQQLSSLTPSITSATQMTALPSSSTLLGLHGVQCNAGTNIIGPMGNVIAYRRVLSVPENVINIILGHQGRSIIDLQLFTGTSIQISQKCLYISGIPSRTVTITGPQVNVQSAADVIEHIVAIEHMKRGGETGLYQQQLQPHQQHHQQQQQQQQRHSLLSLLPGNVSSHSGLDSDYFIQSNVSYPYTLSSSSSSTTTTTSSLSSASMKGNYSECLSGSNNNIVPSLPYPLSITTTTTSTTTTTTTTATITSSSSTTTSISNSNSSGLSFPPPPSSSSSCDTGVTVTSRRRLGGGVGGGSSHDSMSIQSSIDSTISMPSISKHDEAN